MGSTPASNRRLRTAFRGETMLTRRHMLASALAAPAILRFGTGTAHAATTLKISHQFPGGTIDKGDFRDRLCRMFAQEVAKRSGGEISGEIYPNSSLVKTNAHYSAMQTGACDAGITSSTSLISFRLEEVAKSLTSGAGASYWFMLEPLMMSKAIFDKLPKNQQDVILAVGLELEAFGKKGAQDDDIEVAKVYEKAGAKVSKLDIATVGKWRDIARDTAWKDYGAKTAASANLLKLASDVSA